MSMMFENPNTRIKKLVANIFWSLKKDFKKMELQDIYYDVGLMVGYCHSINRPSDKIYDYFMEGK